MRLLFLPALLAVSGEVVSALAVRDNAPALPLSAFNTSKVHLLTLDEILNGPNNPPAPEALAAAPQAATAATCSNPRVRTEWDALSNSDRQAFVNAIKCLQGRPPSGAFSQSRSRYEDFVSLHQNLTPNVHGNAKFLIWHRYFLWAFEDVLRSECGFGGSIPWFDETRYAGHFSSSSIFSSSWFGGIALGGGCVTTGVSANVPCSFEWSGRAPNSPSFSACPVTMC
jgi:tyrosinase